MSVTTLPRPAEATAGTAAPERLCAWAARERRKRAAVLGGLTLLLAALAMISVATGAVSVSPAELGAIFLGKLGLTTSVEASRVQEAVIWSIRLPRVVLGILAGATLAIGGAAIQGLFRNPLAEPGLIGTSSGAAMAAVIAIVAVTHLPFTLPAAAMSWIVSLAAFAGALAATFLVYRLSLVGGRTMVATMLLTGIAVNALAFSVVGLMMFLADDAQLRTIAFWNLGSLTPANWSSLAVVAPLMVIACVALPMMGRAMDALALGEAEAHHLGVAVQRVRFLTVLLVALSVGAAVSVTGVISFVGLVVPHLLRLAVGPNHRLLLPASALLGAALLVGADLLARTIAAPAELPLGVVTALLGAPYFLWLLIRERERGTLL
ncbi:MAG: iron ABC transporter permease [Sumerlaeia bacterium]